MTRQLSCSRQGKGMVGPNHDLPDRSPISLATATAHLRAVEAVGIADLYAESLCVIAWTVRGVLPAGCGDCATNLTTTHSTHNVPPHNTSLIPNKTLGEIDAITRTDRQLFRVGAHRFLHDVRRIERFTGVTILCAERRSAFLRTIAAHDIDDPAR